MKLIIVALIALYAGAVLGYFICAMMHAAARYDCTDCPLAHPDDELFR